MDPKTLETAMVDNQPVMAVEDAIITNGVHVGKSMSTSRKVLLADERTVVVCTHPNDINCTYFAEGVTSVMAHQRSHGKSLVKTLRQQNAELAREKAQRAENYANGAKKAAETRRKNRKALERDGFLVTDRNTGEKIITENIDVHMMYTKLLDAGAQFQAAERQLNHAIEAYINAVNIALKNTRVSEELVDKARKWDQFIALTMK